MPRECQSRTEGIHILSVLLIVLISFAECFSCMRRSFFRRHCTRIRFQGVLAASDPDGSGTGLRPQMIPFRSFICRSPDSCFPGQSLPSMGRLTDDIVKIDHIDNLRSIITVFLFLFVFAEGSFESQRLQLLQAVGFDQL